MAKKKEPPRCKPCKDGFHDNCEHRACWCHCMLPSAPYSPMTRREWTLRPMAHVFDRLKAHGVIARFDLVAQVMVYKPHPNRCPDEIRALLAQYRRELVCALAPHNPGRCTSRPYWTIGPIRACNGCGRSSASYSPLGECMHQHCGLLGQQKQIQPVVRGPWYVERASASRAS